MSGTAITWEVLPSDTDDRPFYGPRCPGYETHGWTLNVEDGDMWLHSGCAECDMAIESHEVVALLKGRLTFEADHPNLGGWHGDVRCDCNYWYRFTPAPAFEDVWTTVAAALTGQSEPSNLDSCFTIEDVTKAVWALLHPEAGS